MLTYARRFHSSGRRKRIRAKLKQFLESNSFHHPSSSHQKASYSSQTKAGSSLGTLSEKLTADVFNELDYEPFEALTEKQILKAHYQAQDPCSLQSPPAYNECVGACTMSEDPKNQVAVGLSILNKKPEPVGLSMEKNEDSKNEEGTSTSNENILSIGLKNVNEKEHPKIPERGRKTNILYKSQLNTLCEQRGMRRPSPKISRRVKALPHDLVCCSMVLQANLMVESWCKNFTALEVFVVATLIIVFATNFSA